MQNKNYTKRTRLASIMKLEHIILTVAVVSLLVGIPAGIMFSGKAKVLESQILQRKELEQSIEQVNQELDAKSHDVNSKIEDIQRLEREKQELEAKLQAKLELKRVENVARAVAQKAQAEAQPAPPVAVSVPQSREQLLRAAGIADVDFPYAIYILNHENGLWCPTRSYGMNNCPASPGNVNVAYGMCQANPGTKMASAGADWRTNAVTQLKWCNSYAKSRYKGWYNAYTFWLANRVW